MDKLLEMWATIDPKLQDSLVNLGVLIVSLVGAWLTARFKSRGIINGMATRVGKTEKDVGAAHEIRRAMEDYLGATFRIDPETGKVKIVEKGSEDANVAGQGGTVPSGITEKPPGEKGGG